MASRHRVLVIGVGSIGERHLRCFQLTGRAELSLVEINEPLRKTVAERYGVSQAHADLEPALADPPDAAVIAAPAHLHIPLAARLAAAGVHLLIEKPLSTTFDGIAALQEVIRAKQLIASVAYVLRSHPCLIAMKQAIDSGRFGRPVQLVAVNGQHFPTYRPAYRDIYYKDRKTGGGAIQDALTHVVNAGEWLIGPVERLVADAAHQVLDGVEVEDTVHLLTRQRAAMGSYTLNQYQAPNESSLTVICERGTARWELAQHRWRWMEQPGEAWHDETIPPLERDTLFVAQANTFLDCLEGTGTIPCTLDEALQTLRVNLAALQSADTSTWQTVAKP